MVLDELGSSVNTRTDDLMKEATREDFGDKTILSVDHRLQTIMDIGRIFILERGRIVETVPPIELMHEAGGRFKELREI